jgi:hypothetical protein
MEYLLLCKIDLANQRADVDMREGRDTGPKGVLPVCFGPAGGLCVDMAELRVAGVSICSISLLWLICSTHTSSPATLYSFTPKTLVPVRAIFTLSLGVGAFLLASLVAKGLVKVAHVAHKTELRRVTNDRKIATGAWTVGEL